MRPDPPNEEKPATTREPRLSALLAEVLEDRAEEAKPSSRDSEDWPERLRRYRAGELDAEETDAFEAELVADPSLRARLAAFASSDDAGAPAASKARALDAFRRARAERSRRRRWVRSVLPLAAALLLAVGLLWRSPEPTLPPDLAFEMTVEGTADRRSGGGARGSAVSAFPGTRLRVTLRPPVEADSEVDVGVYVRRGDLPLRVDRPATTRVHSQRGVLRVEGLAGDWFGDLRGAATLWVVVTPPGMLPDQLPAAEPVTGGASIVESLSRPGQRLVFAHPVILLSEEKDPI